MKRKESATASHDAIICQESLTECIRNFEKNALAEMRAMDVRALARFAGPGCPSKTLPACLRSAKKVSYISADSFETNKNGWSPQSNTPAFIVEFRRQGGLKDKFSRLFSRSYIVNNLGSIQVRGFKTERGVSADMKRNPNIVNRLRK